MRRKALILIICALLVPFTLEAQINHETDSLYISALEYYLASCDSNHIKYPDIYSKIDTIFLEQTDEISVVPSILCGRVIVLITNENWRKIYEQNGNTLIHCKVFPIDVKGDEIEISIIPYKGKKVKDNLEIGLSDWTNVYFKYDCFKKRWVYIRVETGGI
jgi:hypothetical protein